MTNRTKPSQAALIEHLRELNRRTDDLCDFHLPYMRWCGRIHDALNKLDVDIRWEIGRFENELRYTAGYEQDFAAKQKTASKRAKKAVPAQMELADNGK